MSGVVQLLGVQEDFVTRLERCVVKTNHGNTGRTNPGKTNPEGKKTDMINCILSQKISLPLSSILYITVPYVFIWFNFLFFHIQR